jgi:hypothetical protein
MILEQRSTQSRIQTIPWPLSRSCLIFEQIYFAE